MKKLILTADDHTSEHELRLALHASDYAMALWTIKQEVRRILKYEHEDKPINYATMERLQHFINEETAQLPELE